VSDQINSNKHKVSEVTNENTNLRYRSPQRGRHRWS